MFYDLDNFGVTAWGKGTRPLSILWRWGEGKHVQHNLRGPDEVAIGYSTKPDGLNINGMQHTTHTTSETPFKTNKETWQT
eukprot:283798-Amphidinium_carterae.1